MWSLWQRSPSLTVRKTLRTFCWSVGLLVVILQIKPVKSKTLMTEEVIKPNSNRSARLPWYVQLKRCVCLLEEGATPPNIKVIFIVFISLFSSAFSLTFLFPFLPEMVKSFGYAEEEKGYYVGLIASSVFAGRIFGSYFWGWLSDKKGRKMVLLITLSANGIFSFVFGFTTSLAMALVIRFLAGVSNGVVGTAKTILYEISDNSNQALGMSILALAWGTGLFLGPSFGGYLASPSAKYPSVFASDGFFGDFPYILPATTAGLTAVIACFIVFFKFPETYSQKKEEVINIDQQSSSQLLKHSEEWDVNKKILDSRYLSSFASLDDIHNQVKTPGYFSVRHQMKVENPRYNSRSMSVTLLPLTSASEGHSSIALSSSLDSVLHHRSQTTADPLQKSFKLQTTVNISLDNAKQYNKAETLEGGAAEGGGRACAEDCLIDPPSNIQQKKSFWKKMKSSYLFVLLSIPDVRKTVALYTIFSFAVIGFEDTFVIWASTEPRFDGLGFSTNEIGSILGIVSIPLMFIQVLTFSPMVKRIGLLKTFMVNDVVLIVVVTACPITHLLHSNTTWLWITLLLLLIPQRICCSNNFAATSLLINNSIRSGMAGSLNGIAMTTTALARSLAPTFGGSVFAWSISKKSSEIGAPFNVNFVFFLFGLIFWICALICITIPRRLNKQKNTEEN